jgi:hypothetical protein
LGNLTQTSIGALMRLAVGPTRSTWLIAAGEPGTDGLTCGVEPLNHRSTEAAGHGGIGELKVLLLISRASSLVSANDYLSLH